MIQDSTLCLSSNVPFTMGVERFESGKLADMVIVFIEGSEVVIDPSRNSCDSSPRNCAGPEDARGKAFQFEVSSNERSDETRLPVKAAEDEGNGREVGASVVNCVKSQLMNAD